MEKIKVLVVDDSAIVREILSKRLSEHPEIQVVATAPDPFVARAKIESMSIDVITLDIEMPRMDGLTFLRYLMKYKPMPVIVVSSLASKSSKAAMTAFELGAVDVVAKPGGPYTIEETVDDLIQKILDSRGIRKDSLKSYIDENDEASQAKYLTKIATTSKLIVIGASTGGPQALTNLFQNFEIDFPPVVVAIHMPAGFTNSFAHRLNELAKMEVKEGTDNQQLLPGEIYIAPGGLHTTIKTSGSERFLKVSMGPKLFGQRPAVDVLFDSAAESIGKNCIGIILTGMGKDGAQGLLHIKNRGGLTIAQDQKSSIIYGMPKEAVGLGAAHEVLGLDKITEQIKKWLV